MKKSKMIICVVFCSLIFSSGLSAQDLYVYEFVGKTMDEVINHYGKPAHMDKSNPTMMCMFYKKQKDNMVFVSDESSIFQADALMYFESQGAAENEINKVISSALKKNFTADTLSTTEYKFNKTDVGFYLNFSTDPNSSKYQVKVHAERR